MPNGNKRGLVREHPRLRSSTQIRALEANGFDPIYDLGPNCSLADALKSIRPGDVVGVARLWVVAEPKRRGRRQALYRAVDEIEERGASILELDTGRSTTDPKQRDAMIREAAEAVTRAGRGLSLRRNKGKTGRPAVDFSRPVFDQAKSVWESRRYPTWKDVAAALPKGFTVHRAYKLWGKRNTD